MKGKREWGKIEAGDLGSFVGFVFAGSGVNGLMCLRMLGPV